jgi:hypothetical protein
MFKAKGIHTLPYTIDINSNPISAPSDLVPTTSSSSSSFRNDKNKCECNNLYSTFNSNNHTLPCIIHLYDTRSCTTQEINCDALLDTGALQANYMSEEILNKIELISDVYINKTDASLTCTPFSGMCSTSLGSVDVILLIFDETLNNHIKLKLSFKVLKMKYDLIIGRPTIQKYDLTNKCRSQFITCTSNINSLTNNIGTLSTPVERTITVKSKFNKVITLDYSINNKYKSNLCYCDNWSQSHVNKIWSYWAQSGKPLRKSSKPDSSNYLNNLNEMSPVDSNGASGGFGDFWFGHHEISTVDSTVLTLCAIDKQDSASYLKTHIHNLLDKNDDIDELTKEKQLNGDLSPWDIYSSIDTIQSNSTVDSELPTNIHNFKSRHDKLFLKFKHVFGRKVRTEPAKLPAMVLKVDDNLWSSNRHRLPPRIQSQVKQDEIERQCSQMKELNVITHSQSTEWSQVTLAPKPNNKWRFCIDYKYLNLITKGNGYPIPLISAIIQRISRKKAKYYAVIDLTSGYHQAPLAEESRKYTAFRTLNALYEWLRVPFGLKGAPAWFQFIMATIVLVEILYIACELYLDDILIFGETEDEYFHNLEQVLIKLDKYSIVANPDKGKFGMTEVDYVGHNFTQFGVTHNRDRIQKVLDIQQPKFAKQLKSFIGVVEYFHEHVQNFSEILRPLRLLITPYVKTHTIKWTESAILAFNNVKTAINNCQTLYFIDDSAPIFLHTDASDYGIGGYLFQVVDNKEKPVMFMSKSLSESEIKWSTIDKEAYAIVYSLYKFKHLLQGVHFVLRTDHKNLTFVNESKSQRVQR